MFASAIALSFVYLFASASIAPAVFCLHMSLLLLLYFASMDSAIFLYLLGLVDWLSASDVDGSDWIIWLLFWLKSTGL